MNIVANFHAYKFTHFSTKKVDKTKSPEKLSSFGKINTLIFGVNNPRPINMDKPPKYANIQIQSNKKIDCWYLKKNDFAKGTVILFHGYSGEKSTMLDKAAKFEAQNYNIMLVDFIGSGGSEGSQTILGYKEAENVKSTFEYISKLGEKNIILFGTSMGAVAVMKAISEYNLKPKRIIIECPFGTMYKTTCARFEIMNLPAFPMAGLLVFWGGIQNGFWAFGHSPIEYAKQITTPTLLLYGDQDKKVSKKEIEDIYQNLKGEKKLKTYELAGHENYLNKYSDEWTADVTKFLSNK